MDLRIIINLYWNQEASVRIGNSFSGFVAIERGVRQGCVLSPTLYNLYAEKITRSIEDKESIRVGGRNINSIRYADDTTLIANSEAKLIDILHSIYKKQGHRPGSKLRED